MTSAEQTVVNLAELGFSPEENVQPVSPKIEPRIVPQNSRQPPRRQDCPWYVRWSYTYCDPTLRRGQKEHLDEDDIAAIETYDEAENISMRLNDNWKKEVERAKKKNTPPKLWWAAAKTFGAQYSLGGFMFFTESIARIAQAVFLGYLLDYLQNGGSMTTGYYYALGLCLTVLFNAIIHHVDFFIVMRSGMQMRVAFIALIYRKLLSLSTAHTASGGFIVNMVSNDVQRFEDAAPFATYIWLGPLEALLATYFMYLQISWGAFSAVGALMLLIPIQSFFARLFGILRRKSVLLRDDRIRSVADLLSGIMVIKLYAWENPFRKKIQKIRDDELDVIKVTARYRAMNDAFWFSSGAMISAFGFIPYYLIGGVFTPAKVFTTITLLSGLRLSMTNFMPKAFQFVTEAMVSFDRIRSFLLLPDLELQQAQDMDITLLEEEKDIVIIMKQANFTWSVDEAPESKVKIEDPTTIKRVSTHSTHKIFPTDEEIEEEDSSDKIILRNIDATIKKGELVFIVGPVGSGKSSFANAVLGEMIKISGKYAIDKTKTIAYACQNPWIINGTIRENILFGKSFDEKWYNRVIEVCALVHDMTLFANGDHTAIGERGVNLSGGQKARLSLARAVYSQADIYILDDPLSAVDTKVGRHIFDQCINGLIKRHTRLLITHQLQYINAEHQVLLMEQGHLMALGSYNHVVSTVNTPFTKTMKEFVTAAGTGSTEDLPPTEEKRQSKEDADNTNLGSSAQEVSASGTVTWKIYYTYFTSGTNGYVLFIFFMGMVLGQATSVVTDYWLSRWSVQTPDDQLTKGPQDAYVYSVLTLSVFFISMGRAILFFMLCIAASRKVFTDMLRAVLRSPMHFFQTTPIGRSMNRFSKDMNIADEMLPMTVFDFLQCFFIIIGVLATAVAIIPFILVGVPPICVLFYYLRKHFVTASRQIKRLEATTRSPVYSQFSATLEGLSTIRAYGVGDIFLRNFMQLQNENTRMFFCFISTSRWLGQRIDLLSASFLIIIAFLSVALQGSLASNTGLIGLVLSYIIQLLGLVQWCVRQSAEVETLMVSPERMLQYTELPSEAPENTTVIPPPEWPSKGHLLVKNLSLMYPGTESKVLNNINIDIPGGTKVGIVGRTGAGKSSFLQALFRLVEPTPGSSIVLDGINLSDLGLFDLRSRISIIPQEPFCFKGTLRFNIDPFQQYTDEQLWRVLEAVELKNVVSKLSDKLESDVAENGSNWSFGERQLICLARAILKNTGLIVMDEATSAVDLRTDAMIQKAIRSESDQGLFTNSTVITIAHRLNTVIDFDFIMVLDQGEIVEYGRPYEMMTKPSTQSDAWFKRMVDEMGDEAQESLLKLALKTHTARVAKRIH